jgi:hypothetical protein
LLPKEHGAWNALLVSLVVGWMALGQWNVAALAVSILWFSGFVLRAPLTTYRQYRKADPPKARRALGVSVFWLVVLILSGLVFYLTAPGNDIRIVCFTAAPLGTVIFILAAIRRSLRFFEAELLGFIAICLAAPVIYLSSPLNDTIKALWLYVLIGGYFILALLYIKVRQSWVARARRGFQLTVSQRRSQGFFVFLLHGFYIGGVVAMAPSWLWGFGPLYAGIKAGMGLSWGKPNLPIMQLGIREMFHSLIYMMIAFCTWKFFN